MATGFSMVYLFALCFLLGFSHGFHYNTSSRTEKGKLNVHLVAHTHDDVGWLKTLDQYFVGSNNSIQRAAVQYILDSVVEKLVENPDRKFIYVEQAFFQRWWREQNAEKKVTVHELVNSGQLEFINGGWCMHDEATPSFIDMIDQMTLGHRFIKKQFQKVPKVAWQLDPFGHSAVQGYLLSAEAGFQAVFFARADWQDVAKRRREKTMEFIWRGSKTLGSSAEIFGGAMHHHYDPPEGFRYDIENPDPPIQDDSLLFDENVEERVEAFVKAAQEQAAQFRTNHIMWAMGEDFAYSNAQTWFKNMDKLIHYVNKDGRVNALYSTPSIYLESKYSENESWPLKTGDFFPYADNAHNFWTGYFTSRPALKGYIRYSSALLQATRQMEVLMGRNKRPSHGANTDLLEESVAIAQHHDAVSGTSQQHVANDYAKRLHLGVKRAEKVYHQTLMHTLFGLKGYQSILLRKQAGKIEGHGQESLASLEFHQCSLLNISFCPTSEKDLSDGSAVVVSVYNPVAWTRREFIKIPVSSTNVVVTSGSPPAPINSQIVPLGPIDPNSRGFYVEAHAGQKVKGTVWQLVFEAELPPLGFKTFLIKTGGNNSDEIAHMSTEEPLSSLNSGMLTDLGQISIKLSPENGSILAITNPAQKVSSTLKQKFLWYNASNGIQAGPQPSGAYIFRPNRSEPFPVNDDPSKTSTRVFMGPLLNQIHQTSEWVSQVITVHKDSDHVEFEFKVGPIPIDDDFGKEVISHINSDISSGKTFFSDSNCRDYLKRVVDFREDWEIRVTDPVAGNYYPVTAGMYISDELRELSILVDRSVGGTSLKSGEAEIMLHRRLLYDDNKGVAEHLNETVCVGNPPQCQGLTVVGKYQVSLHKTGNGGRWRKSQSLLNLFPVQLAFATIPSELETLKAQVQGVQYSAVNSGFELPPNVALVTLQELHDRSVLLRLAHLFEIDEDVELSKKVTVDVKNLFVDRKILVIEELSLTGNQLKKDMTPLQWTLDPKTLASEMKTEPMRGAPHTAGSTLVELGPMEIRTFSLRFEELDWN